MDQLSRHPVLSKYWDQLSLILKGSTSRGNADRYSDIDLVFYSSEEVRNFIVAAYHEKGLADRTDGIFMFLSNGHYHIESYDVLGAYFAQRDFIHCWDIEHAHVLHDPTGWFLKIVKKGQRQLFKCPLNIVKRAYLDLQLDLDWMRMPITRGDGIAAFLHAAKILQGLCRIAYLLDGHSYPPDKWVARYLSSTRWGRAHGKALRNYLQNCDHANNLVIHSPFAENPLYRDAALLIDKVGRFIQKTQGSQPWLEKWYNYV